MLWWRNDLKGGARRGGANLKKVARAQHCKKGFAKEVCNLSYLSTDWNSAWSVRCLVEFRAGLGQSRVILLQDKYTYFFFISL